MNYIIKYKRYDQLFFRSVKAAGHQHHSDSDRMDIYLQDNKGILSIGEWKNYLIKLGSDFFLEQAEMNKNEA